MAVNWGNLIWIGARTVREWISQVGQGMAGMIANLSNMGKPEEEEESGWERLKRLEAKVREREEGMEVPETVPGSEEDCWETPGFMERYRWQQKMTLHEEDDDCPGFQLVGY